MSRRRMPLRHDGERIGGVGAHLGESAVDGASVEGDVLEKAKVDAFLGKVLVKIHHPTLIIHANGTKQDPAVFFRIDRVL
jgi:hypothetical protein